MDSLKESLGRSYEFERARAEFYRAQRADLATKIRTGLVTLSAASALGIATLYGAISAKALGAAGVATESLVISFFCFAVAAWLGGWSLNVQYVDAINAEGDSTTRAQIRSRAIDGLSSPNRDVTPQALDELQGIPFVRGNHDQLAITLHSLAWSAWGIGILDLAVSVAQHAFGSRVVALLTAIQRSLGH